MSKSIVWRDDVHVFTIDESSNILYKDDDHSFIYWLEKDQRFPVQCNEVNRTFTLNSEALPLEATLTFICGGITYPIYARNVVRTKWFEDHYAPMNEQLGVFVKNNETYFSIWAPTATKILLYLENKKIQLNRHKHGVWKINLQGNFHLHPYEYEIWVNGESKMVNDPYAKSLLANSSKSVVIDFEKTWKISSQRPKINQLQDSIIYELHVRDATIHSNSGVKNKGKFLGLTEEHTKTQNGHSTCLSYIKDLGVTHVQILPINDFARVDEHNPDDVYNWGYDPLYFQALEGSYSLNPNDPLSRINECKQMIHAFHNANLSVIIDVVFNHVFEVEHSPFEQIVPFYYFRYDAYGQLSNGTGVGNDFASERKMARKFILDTIDLLLTEYHVSGFRFDLMGVLDIETMQAIKDRCAEEENPILLLGEGWDLPTALPQEDKAISAHSNQLTGIRFFNDFFRDKIKGSSFSYERGFINGNGHYNEYLPFLITGSVINHFHFPFVTDVTQVVNYIECHDNHTLWDGLALKNANESIDIRKKMHQLGSAITILSQGIPFIHAGQEWFRTKSGDENSYISPDSINQLDWNQKEMEEQAISFIKDLIHIRKKHPVFRLIKKEEIIEKVHILNTNQPVFAFTLFDQHSDICVCLNPTNQLDHIHLPTSGLWKIAATNIPHESSAVVKGEFLTIQPYEAIVLIKDYKNERKQTKTKCL